ncbi:hypothetical protein LIER_00094 [Lithospermum erythrorhizon]|uniref:Uncharacterized protein n=1 Tax=Lithospermum erythrorhizon TaxID=34254 RepID=A0AAV3NG76_LITER
MEENRSQKWLHSAPTDRHWTSFLYFCQGNGYYELKHISMLIFWQVPQDFIVGCVEGFNVIGELELYQQAPDAMRSLCSATAMGNYLSTLLVNCYGFEH